MPDRLTVHLSITGKVRKEVVFLNTLSMRPYRDMATVDVEFGSFDHEVDSSEAMDFFHYAQRRLQGNPPDGFS